MNVFEWPSDAVNKAAACLTIGQAEDFIGMAWPNDGTFEQARPSSS